MRRSVVIALILLALLALLALALSQCKKGPGEPEKQALHLPVGTPKRPQGMGALAIQPGQPQPFSKTDVATYLQSHNLPLNRGAATDVQVDSLEFLTNKEVSDRLQGASPGLADNEKVGFATLTGTFIFTGPPPGKPVRFSRGYAVFDALTGNLLMVGALEEGREQPPR
jgi:hypothetical protein